ncbi:hypothetical protein ABT352_23800 [Streptosporangium sp. NPDC000563]|uniref:hypothetical protein n=1 Tax=Streptosporangium sp. NPDC000563 TaxID=3154366 RepID=UPI00331D02CB
MKNLPSLLAAPVRHGAFLVLLVLALTALTGCGLTGGQTGDGAAAPAQVTSEATTAPAESDPPAQPESTPEQAETGGQDRPSAAVEPGGTLVDGSTVSAELTRAGERHKFTLDLGDAREFYVADMEGDGIQFQVFSDVDDEPLTPASVDFSAGTSLSNKLTKVGGHRLEVWGNTNVIGAYSFRIATVKVRTFPATIGLKIGEGSPEGAGSLDVPGRIDRFEFDADGAKAIRIIAGGGPCTSIDVELYDAAEKSLADPRQPYPLCGNEFDMPLSGSDGRYALVVRSPAAKTGSYSFQIVRAG